MTAPKETATTKESATVKESTTSKETQRISINLTNPEIMAKFNQLKAEGKSNPDFIMELLEAYEKFSGRNCSSVPENYFPNLQGKEKVEKEPHIREIFGLQPNDPLLISECELLEKAKEYSGKSIEDMALEGRVLIAKNEVGRQIQYKMGKGKQGSADERLAQTLEFMKQSEQKMSINRLTQLSGSNRKTVEAWCKRNEVTFE